MIELIQSRQSVPKLSTPAPSASQWQSIIQCGLSAPDHGRLKPWRFYLIEGEGLKALGKVFVNGLTKDKTLSDKDLDEAALERARNLPFRAPAILAVGAKILHNHKIPAIEQISATAAACQNIQLGLHSLGYGSIWRTGDFAFNPVVKAAFGLEPNDELVGFLYVGTPIKTPPLRDMPNVSDFFQQWTGGDS